MTVAPSASRVVSSGERSTPCAADRLSIVIVSWNTRELLRACLASIETHRGGLELEVFVVDNASTDGSAEMVASTFPEVRLIRNADNRGFAAANNQALALARGRYALLLNPDTVVLDDVLTRAVDHADAHPDIGVLGCQVLQDNDTLQPTCFRFPSPFTMLLFALGLTGRGARSPVLGYAEYGGWDRCSEREVDVVSGVFMLVRRAAMDEVGLMDEDYFVYAEETDWCRRFRAAGWRCVFAPVGRILHVDGGGNSTAQIRVPMYVQMQKNLLLFHRKQRGLIAWGLARLVLLAFMPLRAGWWTGVSRVRGTETARHKAAQARATVRFLFTGQEPGP